MSRRLSSFLPRLSVNSSRNATPRFSHRNFQSEFEIVRVWTALSASKLRLLPASPEQCVSPWEPGLFRRTHVGVGFNVAPLLFHNATQFALHGLKCIVDDFFERFVSAVIHLFFIGHKLVPRRHGHVDPAPVWIPFVMVVIGLLDCDIAAVDVITKSLESCCIIQNEIVDLVRFFQTPIRYLNRQLHNYLDTTALLAVEGTKNLGSCIPFKFAATIGNG
jgi:hypothetical protein